MDRRALLASLALGARALAPSVARAGSYPYQGGVSSVVSVVVRP